MKNEYIHMDCIVSEIRRTVESFHLGVGKRQEESSV